jgi:hypothetical protein
MVAALHNPHCVDNFGRSGPGLAVALARQQYDVGILMAGTNDLGLGYPAGVSTASILSPAALY